MQMQPMGVVVQQQSPVAISAAHLNIVDPVDPARHAIIYSSRLHPRAKCLMCMPGGCGLGAHAAQGCICCGPCCHYMKWESELDKRSYVRVYENKFEVNYATPCCFGTRICDNTHSAYFDQTPESWVTASCCTPFHCFCCLPCSGEVVATADPGCLNCFLCPACRTFYPGLPNGVAFLTAFSQARNITRAGARLPAGAYLTAPGTAQMH